ncbi:MAG TPA: CoA transferase subunit A [Dehalococcoidales bacterium]|nr:CoA transferase subunit A [Dehalococcoidales bacterium]
MDKVFPSVEEAVKDIPDGATVGFTGFFTCGNPVYLTRALAKQGSKNLTIVVMQLGVGNDEINLLLENGQVKKAICNYPFYRSFSRQSLFEQLMKAGKVECELFPMGTFAEKLRAAGAGIPAFYTPTGAGTLLAEGKEARTFNGRECLMETALPLDYGLVHAWKADRMGNVVFRKTARNYNPDVAKAARITIVEAENVVEPGELDPDLIHLPSVYVTRVVKVDRPKINVTIEKS